MSIEVIKPGMLSSLQDLGRWHYQNIGVGVAGAMDPTAFQLANLLVGNDSQQACLEISLTGPSLLFQHNACIAITGAFLSPYLDDTPIQNNRSYIVTSGQTLHFKMSSDNIGARSYLAVHGGFQLPPVLNSCSTDLKTKLGGWHGRALQKGDVLKLNGRFRSRHLLELKQLLHSQRIYLPSGLSLQPRSTIRVTQGTHFGHFTEATQEAFFNTEFKISSQSDRMGYRLQGATLNLTKPLQIYSEPTAFGTIQVPPDGNPIVLMADRQSTGGYPKIANVITADLSYLAQSVPGQSIRFQSVSLSEAQQIWITRQQRFKQLREQIHATLEFLREKFIYF